MKITKVILTKAIITITMAFSQCRVFMASKSVRFFAWYYLRVNLFVCQERWIYRLLRTRRGLVLAPAGHGKTEVTSKILPLWHIVRNRNIRILIVAKSDGLAKKNLMVIRNELRYNERIINDYGGFYEGNNKWEEHQIVVIRSQNLKDPTVEAVGMGGAITGGRFDLMIFDDIIDVLSVLTEAVRLKTEDYVDGTLIPRLEPQGVVWAIGTRKHYSDIYNHFLNNPVWSCVEERAIAAEPRDWNIVKLEEPDILEDGTEQWYKVIIEGEDKGEALCPEKWPIEALLLHRFTIGSVVFEREYQNIIVSDAMALFKIGWMKQCRSANLSYIIGDVTEETRSKYVVTVQGVDTALIADKKEAESKRSDYNVIATLGLRKDGVRELLKIFRERGLSPDRVQRSILREYESVQPDYTFLETNSFGMIHAHNLIEKTGIRLVKHHTGANKSDLYEGVPGLSVLFENAKYRLPYKTPEDKRKTDRLITEFHRLGSEDHDDIVMAVWIAENGILRYLKGQAKLGTSRKRPKNPRRR